MTEILRTLLLWTGIGLALLASLVVAPDAPPRLIQKVRAAVYRYLPFLRPRQSTSGVVKASKRAGWPIEPNAHGDSWDPNGTVDERIQALRNQVVELSKLVATTKAALRAELNRKIADVTAQLEVLRAEVTDLRSAFAKAEEQSSDLDARGLPPIGFGILLSGAPAELASVPWLGWPLAVVGVGLVVWCVIVLVKHRMARRTAAATAAAAGIR